MIMWQYYYARIPLFLRNRIENPFFAGGGMIAGFCGLYDGIFKGTKDAYDYEDGYVWRPVVYGSVQASSHGLLGLFWPEIAVGVIAYDAYKSFSK